ncbi:MAG: glycosyltransferase, partial [Gemmatimonadetes bacterium]|nr:glycosyltransferase [Gemmatimonadota bacterium]
MSNLAALCSIVGDAHAREADAADAIDGVTPRFCVAPASAQEVSAVLRLASESRWAVSPRGRGTRLDLGNLPAKLDVVLSTARLDRLVEHAAGDLVATGRVGFAGELDASGVRAELRAAHLFVLPSEAEGMPIAMLEAMAEGRPVLVTDAGNMRSVVD